MPFLYKTNGRCSAQHLRMAYIKNLVFPMRRWLSTLIGEWLSSQVELTYTWLAGKNDTIGWFVYFYRASDFVVELCDMVEYPYVFGADPD